MDNKQPQPRLSVAFLIGSVVSLIIGLMSNHRYQPEDLNVVAAVIAGVSSGFVPILSFWYFSRSNRAILPFLLVLAMGFVVGASAAELWHGTPPWFVGIAFVVYTALMLFAYQRFVRRTRKSDHEPPETDET